MEGCDPIATGHWALALSHQLFFSQSRDRSHDERPQQSATHTHKATEQRKLKEGGSRSRGELVNIRVGTLSVCRRSYPAESTGSHPNSEVKLLRDRLVLRWGTTRESWLTATPFFFVSIPLFFPWQLTT